MQVDHWKRFSFEERFRERPTSSSPYSGSGGHARTNQRWGGIDNKSQRVVRSDAKEHGSVRSLLTNDNSGEAVSKVKKLEGGGGSPWCMGRERERERSRLINARPYA